MAECTPEVTPVPPPAPRVRHDWYQTETHVVITILAKNVDAEKTKVDVTKQTLHVSTRLPTGDDYNLDLDLAFPVDPSQCSHKIMPSKIEVKLKKLEGIRWATLEADPNAAPVIKTASIPAAVLSGPPQYPSSSKKTRDWDKLDIEEDKPEGEAALNALFQKIYAEGNDEVRKAMNKSFSESGGTVLSTNWGEVAASKVDVKAPEGQEFRKWE